MAKGSSIHVDDRYGLLPTPPMPDGLPAVELTENARQVLVRRYVRRGRDGKPVETVEEMFWRVAYHVAAVEQAYGEDVIARACSFYELLTSKRFFPNSPTFTGAGTPLGQLAACFVLPIADDMGRDPAGIFQTLRDAALIQQTGGGNGFSFSRLRPKGALVKSSAGQATGPVGFLRVYDKAFGEVAQGGCLLPETLVFTGRGLLRLDEIADPDRSGWQEHRLQIATDEGWRSSPRAFNNGVAAVFRVHTQPGLSLAGTAEHRVKVMTAGGPQWRRIHELQAGDWLMVQLGRQQGAIQPLRRPSAPQGSPAARLLPPVLDEELAFFTGYLAGAGCLAAEAGGERIGVNVASGSYLVEEMPALLGRLFGASVRRRRTNGDRPVTFVIDSRAVKEYLQVNGLALPPSREAGVPRLVRQSPPQVVGAYLRGLFEADGALSRGRPSLVTGSPRLAEETATLLIGLGCPVSIRAMSPGVSPADGPTAYQVRVEPGIGLQAWRERIGCDRRSRFNACYIWQPNPADETADMLPYPQYWLQPALEALAAQPVGPRSAGQAHTLPSRRLGLRRALLHSCRDVRGLSRAAYDRLRQRRPQFDWQARSPEGLWFVKVEAVTPDGEALTLDLEVDQNHTYLANGLVTHNSRRGANMAVLRVDHPDVEEFITCKTDENSITNFNISVGITDAFMRAVRDDADWELRFPDINAPEYKEFNGTLEEAEAAGVPIRVYKTVRARELFDKIVRQAHHNGEPGVLFLDAANRSNPVPHLYQLEATNPCFIGETRLPTEFGLLTIAGLAELGLPGYIAADNRAGGGAAPGRMPGVALRPASPAWLTRRSAPVFRLETQLGYSVTATADHRFLTTAGYRPLQDLRPGDRVLLQSGEGPWSRETRLPAPARQLAAELAGAATAGAAAPPSRRAEPLGSPAPAGLPTHWSHELGLALGALVGAGQLPDQRCGPVGDAFSSPALLPQAYACLVEWFGPQCDAAAGSLPQAFFSALGLLPVPAGDARLPESLWSAPRPAVVGFLQGLFGAAGALQPDRARVRLEAGSPGLLQDVQLLLANFAILSRLEPSGALVLSAAGSRRFAEQIGFAVEAQQARLQAAVRRAPRAARRQAFSDAVRSVTPAGTADVYDLSQPQTASLIANGMVAHNCGEQWLGPAENCCLGSVNLAQHLGPGGTVDWEKLRHSTMLSTIFLDDVVDANAYVPAVPQLKEAAHRARRIGLGIMGLGDLLYHAGVRYGSPEGQAFAAQVMEFVRYHAMQTSLQLAEQRGAFPAIQGSIYDPQELRWQPPQSLVDPSGDWGRPALDWDAIVAGIRRYGIRNAAQTTVAPTGTIATVAGCEGYGCEPVFALAYIRHVNDHGKDLQLTYASPLFEQALITAGIEDADRRKIVEHVMEQGSCQALDEVPQALRSAFVVSGDISAEEHVRMQAALQAFVDNSLSKTVNFNEGATEQDVAQAYLLAWELGCKGITVYVTGSRSKVVLETKATAKSKEAPASETAAPAAPAPEPVVQPMLWHDKKKPRPRKLTGYTINVSTPLGKAFVTINENGGNQPFEVFINTSKAGSDTAAVSEAIGRLVSYMLRLSSPIAPRERLKEIWRQLSGIGGGRSLGFGPNRVRSLPDGVSQALAEYLETTAEEHGEAQSRSSDLPEPETDAGGGLAAGHSLGGNGFNLLGESAQQATPPQPSYENFGNRVGDLCPECGQASVVNEEGCRKCYSCGYSEC
ncbi:MAG: ribonucleotide reductase N-terminal alpha domain-containing protein [Chloroflexota bacterium]